MKCTSVYHTAVLYHVFIHFTSKFARQKLVARIWKDMTLPSDLTLKQDLLNASRFIAITRKSLSTCGDYIDTDKLYQLIATLTFICKSLDSLTQLTPKAAALQVQLEDLREELSSKLYFANEMKKINSQTLCKESDHVSTAILSVLPSCILTSESEHMHSRDADIVSGERIHSLLQQQKVRYLIDDHLLRSTLSIKLHFR